MTCEEMRSSTKKIEREKSLEEHTLGTSIYGGPVHKRKMNMRRSLSVTGRRGKEQGDFDVTKAKQSLEKSVIYDL